MHIQMSLFVMQDRIQEVDPKAIILSGGPNSVHIEGAPTLPTGFFEWADSKHIPVLGICYGALLCHQHRPFPDEAT